jgi:hypothetical protein
MIVHYVKAACEFASAAFAVAASLAWFRAARAPVPFITFPDFSDPAAVQAALDSYAGFVRGTVWNGRAALLAGASALASFAAWVASWAS